MVKAVGESFFDGQRAAEAHAAEHGELRSPLEKKADDLEEVLIPTHRNAVLRHAAKPGHHAALERLAQLVDVADRPERHAVAIGIDAGDLRIERLDLQAVDADHGMTVVHEMVRDGEAGRTEADHE